MAARTRRCSASSEIEGRLVHERGTPRPSGRRTMSPEPQATAMERRPLPSRFELPLVGDTLAFARDASGFLARRARELGPVFEINVFGHPTACFVGPEAFALILDDRNVERTSANPPHVEAIFNPRAVPFLD